MKPTLLATLLLAAALPALAQTNTITTDTNSPASGIWGEVQKFFANNPTNKLDLSSYALFSTQATNGWGGGLRASYWLTPAVGAAIQVDYCDSSWTFASLGLAGRGTLTLGSIGSLTPYVTAGPAWNIRGKTPSLVAEAGAGGELAINAIKWLRFFGEYQHITVEPAQDRFLIGITHPF